MSLRFAVAIAAVLVISVAAAAPPRSAGPRAPKLVPKIGSINAFTSAQQLAASLAGAGVTIANARYTGDPLAAGTFTGGQVDIGIDSGVILSTGRVGDAQGPNQSDAWSHDFELPGDPDLDALVLPNPTHDAAILEFDVTPAADTLAVRFVFASEEYNEFVGTDFNDVVAIFVNGVNCANFNGRPVSVNTINKDVNGAYFVDNEMGTRNTEMDGMTVPLECVAAVTPGVVNHVKIAIADTTDGIYDAVVFVAGGGIRSPGAGPLTTSTLIKVIEYYHAVFDHYFMTAIPEEIAKLDNGTFVGWTRTGQAFSVFLLGTPGTVEVCRFFSTAFTPKSSHFYTPYAPECAAVKQNPNWQFEASVFDVALPNADATCPSGTRPLYRVYNDGMGAAPNHRYTTDFIIFSIMLQLGWKPEGVGLGIIACVPT
jgi:hypothetical protein